MNTKILTLAITTLLSLSSFAQEMIFEVSCEEISISSRKYGSMTLEPRMTQLYAPLSVGSEIMATGTVLDPNSRYIGVTDMVVEKSTLIGPANYGDLYRVTLKLDPSLVESLDLVERRVTANCIQIATSYEM